MPNKESTPNIRASDNSVVVGGISVGGDIRGNITIGNTTGYTVDQVSVLITQIQSTFQPKPFDGRCPYKGLDVFEEEDAELFFGREKLVDDLVSRVKDSRTVFVTGPSGSGKSSLVRAGLIHALKQGAIKGSERWLYATMKPGRDPIGELGRVVSSLASSTNPEDEIRAKAMTDTTIFARWCEITLKEGRDKRLVLFIDQFEEVFTQISKEEERVAFLNLLTHAATVENGRVIILFSMRSDFVSNCATYPQLNELLSKQFRQVGAMQPEELVSAIAQPALRVGLRIDPDLIAQIINEMKGEPGALPLMQFALKDLFDSQHEKSGVPALILHDYLQRGGIHKALERHADDSFAKLNKDEQELARSIFSGLIEIGRGTQDTKRTALFDELVPANTKAEEVESIVQKLADARLITTDESAGRDTVTISHEKLIDAWPWLKKLVNENRDVIALQNEIAADAKEWEERKRDTSYLYTGGRLANVREQVKKQKLALTHLAQEFIRTGSTRQKRRQVLLTSASSVILIAAILASVVFRNQAQSNIEIANTAQAASTFAIAQQETAKLAQAKAEEQANIALARQLSSQALPLYSNENPEQETAVLLATQSMRLFPHSEAAQILQSNTLANLITETTQNSEVHSVAFSPDGDLIVSGGCDKYDESKVCIQGSAHVWEAITGKEVMRLPHNGEVYSVTFSPNGNYIALEGCNKYDENRACIQGSAQVWDANTGKEIAHMIHEGWVRAIAFSPNGNYIVSGSEDKTARVWETSTGREIARMTYDDWVSSVGFSPDGKNVVSGSADGTARVWDATTGKEISRMIHDASVTSVAFSPDGQFIISGEGMISHRDPGMYGGGGSYSTYIWEAINGKEIFRMPNGSDFVAFSPDGNYFASIDGDIVHVWTTTGDEVSKMSHDSSVNAFAFSPNGKYIVSGSSDKTARLWEIVTGKEIVRMTHDIEVISVAFSPSGKYVVSGGCDKLDSTYECTQGSARVWEANLGTIIQTVQTIHSSNNLVFSPDGKFAFSEDHGRTAFVWEVATGKVINQFIHDGFVDTAAFSLDGNFLVSGSSDPTTGRIGDIYIWEIATGKEIAHIMQNSYVNSVAFSPDGKFIVSGSADKTSRIWEIATSKEIAQMIQDGSVNSVAFSPDGKFIVSGSTDKTARVWEIATSKEIARVMHDSEVTDVTFSPDGKLVVSGSVDKTARAWEASTGKEIARMTHDDSVSSIAFSPNGKFAASGSNDHTARVWEIATGKETARVTHDVNVNAVIFTPDSRFVISASSIDGTVRVWIYRPEDLISEACSRVTRNLTRAEWHQYIGDMLQYQAVCDNLPIEPEVTPTPNPTSAS